MLITLPLLVACGDKESDTASAVTDDTASAETTPEESVSTYTAGSYRVDAFSLITDATIGQDIDGDGEADNKLPSVLNLAAGITGTNLYVDNGIQVMAAAIDSESFKGYQFSYPFAMPGSPTH